MLGTRTEGWVAGLQLAALAMRGRMIAGSMVMSMVRGCGVPAKNDVEYERKCSG